MNYTKAQQDVIDSRNCNLLVSAAAGSGKTAVLVERIIQMVFDNDNPIDIDRLLVVTFTKAAASQMKDKISQAIERMLEVEPDNEYYIKQMNLVGQANILTIDSFCYKIVKEYFHVLSIDPGIRIAEEADLAILQQDILEEVMEEFYGNNEAFAAFSESYSADKNDAAVEDYILKIYNMSESYPYPRLWLEAAKKNLAISTEEDLSDTAYAIRYYEEIHHEAEDIRAEILRCLEDARRPNGPIHYEKALLSDISMCDSIISAKTYGHFSDIAGTKFESLGRAKKGIDYDEMVADHIKTTREKCKKRITKILAAFTLPVGEVIVQYNAQREMLEALVDAVIEFSNRYMQAKLDNGIVGFSDVEHFALNVVCDGLDENGNPNASTIGKEISEQFEEILIDEYQDSNYLQEDILKCVSGKGSGNNNIFMVGDVKQSIYGFRMARPDLFIHKYDTYSEDESAPERKIILKKNFRSRENVLNAINYIFYQIMKRELGGIEYTEKEALAPGKDYPEYDGDEVELLIGESKEADYMTTSENGKENEPEEEHLDDEYIDVGAMELEASMTAARIRELMGSDGGRRYEVYDDKLECMRPVEYRDIVILFRSPKSYQPIFSEILMGNNIPIKLQNENGYFDTVEIRGLLCLLRVIDNPYNDVEFTGLLRGYFGGFSNDELALFSIAKREYCSKGNYCRYMYEFIELIADDPDAYKSYFDVDNIASKQYENMSKKCHELICLVRDFQNKKMQLSISELLENIYYGTGYYYYIEAMPEGIVRCRNLSLFLGETRRFEKDGYRSLFSFLRFVNRLSEKGIALGGDPALESAENVVRIMSIHKSKGLEFPVVFLSGLGKRFNLQDAREPIIIHSDYYIGARYVDPVRRCGNDTFIHKVLGTLTELDNLSEELRILYVALTRAKEKLIMTGVTPDVVSLIQKYKSVALQEGSSPGFGAIRGAISYLELIVAAFIRNKVFRDAMLKVPKRYNKKGEIISGEYDIIHSLDTPKFRLKVNTYDYKTLVVSHVENGVEITNMRFDKMEHFIHTPAEHIDELKAHLEWRYADEEITKQKSKLSVTEIQRRYELLEGQTGEESDGKEYDVEYKKIIPRFASKDRVMTASEKGTWFHKVMERIDIVRMTDRDSIGEMLEELYEAEMLPEDTRTFITVDKLYSFAQTSLADRMRKAALDNRLWKERKFVIGVPVNDDAPEIIVQGIIDAYFEENGELVLLDYKTDNIKSGQEKMLAERYKTQLNYYKRTLEQLKGIPVKEMYLYSFALDKEIEL